MSNLVNPYRFGGGSAFSPTDIAGLELWYDTSDISTLWTDDGSTQVSSDGDLVYRWDDKSGNGGHAKQATSDDRPTYKVNAGGNPTSLQFDSTDWLDNVLYIPDTRPMTAFAVTQSAVDSTGTALALVDSGASSVYVRILLRGTGELSFDYRNGGTEAFVDSSSTYDDGANHVFTAREVSAAERAVWVDGADNVTDSTDIGELTTQDIVSIGRLSDLSPGSEWDDYILEIIVYDTALSTGDRGDVEAYLISKWSI